MNAIQLHCARHCKPRRQNGQSKPFSQRVSAANCPEGKRGPSGALGAAQNDPQGGWEASRATGRELCDIGHPVLEDSPEGAPTDRSPRRIATWAASVVAVPRAFFGAFFGPFFRFERKDFSPRGRQPHHPRRKSARQPPLGTASSKVDVHRYKHEAFLRTAITRFTLPCLFA